MLDLTPKTKVFVVPLTLHWETFGPHIVSQQQPHLRFVPAKVAHCNEIINVKKENLLQNYIVYTTNRIKNEMKCDLCFWFT